MTLLEIHEFLDWLWAYQLLQEDSDPNPEFLSTEILTWIVWAHIKSNIVHQALILRPTCVLEKYGVP